VGFGGGLAASRRPDSAEGRNDCGGLDEDGRDVRRSAAAELRRGNSSSVQY
jgi:hypothetical protein